MRVTRVLPLLIGAAVLGCGPSVDPEVAALRSELLLSARPEGGVGIVDAKAAVADAAGEVVLNAQITSGEYAYWEADAAIFTVSDRIDDDGHGGEGHDPSTCPFCKRRLAKLMDRLAMVQVVDSAGNTVPMDARELLGIEENQRIVLQGRAEVDQAGKLVLKANKVFIDS